MSTSPRDEMTEDEIAMRKFLKQLGVTAHQELEAALKAAVADGRIAAGAELPVSAVVRSPVPAKARPGMASAAACRTSASASWFARSSSKASRHRAGASGRMSSAVSGS